MCAFLGMLRTAKPDASSIAMPVRGGLAAWPDGLHPHVARHTLGEPSSGRHHGQAQPVGQRTGSLRLLQRQEHNLIGQVVVVGRCGDHFQLPNTFADRDSSRVCERQTRERDSLRCRAVAWSSMSASNENMTRLISVARSSRTESSVARRPSSWAVRTSTPRMRSPQVIGLGTCSSI